MKTEVLFLWAMVLAAIFLPASMTFGVSGEKCAPTKSDMLGPFYKAGAPERSSVSKGYVVSGMVKSSFDCSAIRGVRLEFWLAGPDGEYGDNYRATLFSDQIGNYHFESHFPPAYSGRPPHIHIKASVKGFRTLVTQHYPVNGTKKATFDIVLVPEK